MKINNYFLFTVSFVIGVSVSLTRRMSKDDVKYTKLKQWAIENGSIFGDFEIKYLFGNNRFGIASNDIKKGDNIVNLPEALILTENNSNIKPTCDKYKIKDKECLRVYVCEELKNQNSFFKLYFNFLPYDYSTYPIFYSNDLKHLIKGSIIEDKANKREEFFKNEYKKLKKKNIMLFSYLEYKQCSTIVESRNFIINYNNKHISALVPISDLFNFYQLKTNVNWVYDNTTKSFKIEASKNIQKGEEIFVPYGNHENTHYLDTYGFTLPENIIRIPYKYKYKGKEVILSSPAELKTPIRSYRTNLSKNIIDVQDEISALNNLFSNLKQFKRSYTTKLKDDIQQITLPEVKKNFNLMNIYTILIEEKKLLKEYIKIITDILSALNLKDNNAIKNKLTSMSNAKSPKYIATLLKYFQELQISLKLGVIDEIVTELPCLD